MTTHWIPEETLRKNAQAAVKDVSNFDLVQVIIKMVEQVLAYFHLLFAKFTVFQFFGNFVSQFFFGKRKQQGPSF